MNDDDWSNFTVDTYGSSDGLNYFTSNGFTGLKIESVSVVKNSSLEPIRITIDVVPPSAISDKKSCLFNRMYEQQKTLAELKHALACEELRLGLVQLVVDQDVYNLQVSLNRIIAEQVSILEKSIASLAALQKVANK